MTGLYNTLFGRNPFERILLKAINIDMDKIPRYRDCYLTNDGNIVIYTRTGGGNREFYEAANENEESDYPGPYNSDLRANPNFINDEDDSFDPTYAYFYYKVPEEHKGACDLLSKLGAIRNPNESWHNLLDRMSKGQDNAELQAYMAQLTEMLRNL
jgi:hypothetical protein